MSMVLKEFDVNLEYHNGNKVDDVSVRVETLGFKNLLIKLLYRGDRRTITKTTQDLNLKVDNIDTIKDKVFKFVFNVMKDPMKYNVPSENTLVLVKGEELLVLKERNNTLQFNASE